MRPHIQILQNPTKSSLEPSDLISRNPNSTHYTILQNPSKGTAGTLEGTLIRTMILSCSTLQKEAFEEPWEVPCPDHEGP